MEIPFSSSARTSLGVEWELELVDRGTRELTSGASPILAELAAGPGGDGEGGHPRAKHELLESTIEVITGVCGTVAEAKKDLAATVADVGAVADRHGLGLMCSGTHPITDYETQCISPNPRYARLIEHMQWLARRLQIFGVHVHVGVRATEKVIPIVNALSGYIPHFLALSASSPYWLGMDTGLASSRSKVFESLPTAGLPHQFSNWGEFEDFMETLLSSRTIESIREVWWDIRPHPTFGTVELRMCDGLPTLFEIGAIAALAQCLVERMDGQIDRGYTLPQPKGWVVRENKWRAARYGLDAQIMVDGYGTTRPVQADIADLVDDLMPVARRLGCTEELSDVLTIVEVGASYARQRDAARRAGGDLRAVVDTLLEEMSTGRPVSVGR
ncbi:MAG: glutamate--cysteine ligase [Frankia sp.]